MKRLAVVVQRYGDEIIGGAESAAKNLCEIMAKNLDIEIDVYTTTSVNYRTWDHFYKEGISSNKNITIKRFKPVFTRQRFLLKLVGVLLQRRKKLNSINSLKNSIATKLFRIPLEKLWFILQGPFCPSLISDLYENRNEYEHIIFFTYLYYPTIFGIHKLSNYRNIILIPTAHDEKAFYYVSVNSAFQKALYILPNGRAEKQFIERHKTSLKNKLTILGVGIDERPPPYDDSSNIPKKPFLLFLGRISKDKSIDELIEYFIHYKKNDPNNNIQLCLAGKLDGSIQLKEHKDIVVYENINDNFREALLKNMLALINPSHFESLSLIVLEGIFWQKPVLVSGKCNVLKDYSEHLPSVFSFYDSRSFTNLCEFIQSKCWKKYETESLLYSHRWVMKRYSWEKIIRKLSQLLHIKFKPL